AVPVGYLIAGAKSMSTKPSSKESTFGSESVERRRWTRTPAQGTEITVVRGGASQAAAVVDESYGGIGIRLREVADLVQGQTLHMLYRGVPVAGAIRSILPEDDDQHRVGLEWLSTRQ